jgi:hypothetical protein
VVRLECGRGKSNPGNKLAKQTSTCNAQVYLCSCVPRKCSTLHIGLSWPRKIAGLSFEAGQGTCVYHECTQLVSETSGCQPPPPFLDAGLRRRRSGGAAVGAAAVDGPALDGAPPPLDVIFFGLRPPTFTLPPRRADARALPLLLLLACPLTPRWPALRTCPGA